MTTTKKRATPTQSQRLLDQMRREQERTRYISTVVHKERAEALRREQERHYAMRDVMAERVARHPNLAELVLDGRVPFHEAFKLAVMAGVEGPGPEAVEQLAADMDRVWAHAPDLAERLDIASHRAKFALAREVGVLQEYCG